VVTVTARLLLVFGGRSSEHEISIRSATEVLAVVDRRRWTPVLLGIGKDGTFRTGPTERPLAEIAVDGAAVADLRALDPSIVFPLLHGPFGEDGTFQGLLEVLGLPYVGSRVLASALCMDKAVFKRFAAAPGLELPQVPWLEVGAFDLVQAQARAHVLDQVERVCGYPCFVKPANLGSSVGISRVEGRTALEDALALAARYDRKLVVEKGVDAREIELAVLGDGGPDTIVSAPGEIRLPPGEWYDYDNKYLRDVARLDIPADLPPELCGRLQALTLRVFRATGCRDLARVDFLVDRRTLEPWVNEVNTIPGFTSISMYPKLMGHAGVPYATLIDRLCGTLSP
jgi:D-alanine-D-alanine ligase